MSFGVPKPSEANVPAKNRGGRPTLAAEHKIVKKTVGLVQSEWDWLELFWTGDEYDNNPSAWLRELVVWAMRFWPKGPKVFGRVVVQPRHKMPAALGRYAAEHGLTRKEAAALIVKEYLSSQADRDSI